MFGQQIRLIKDIRKSEKVKEGSPLIAKNKLYIFDT